MVNAAQVLEVEEVQRGRGLRVATLAKRTLANFSVLVFWPNFLVWLLLWCCCWFGLLWTTFRRTPPSTRFGQSRSNKDGRSWFAKVGLSRVCRRGRPLTGRTRGPSRSHTASVWAESSTARRSEREAQKRRSAHH